MSHINKSGKLVEKNIMLALSHFQSNIFYLNLDTFNDMHRIHCAGIFVYSFILGKGRLPSAQTLLVVANMKFGANEISVTFIIKLNVGATSTQ